MNSHPTTPQGSKPVFRILMGNGEGELNEFLKSTIAGYLAASHDPQFTTCGKAEELIVAARQREYSLFFLFLNNIQYPGLSGGEPDPWIAPALELVRQLKVAYRKPIVATTGHNITGLDTRAEQAGADIFLLAPFTPMQLIDLLTVCLETTRDCFRPE